jgi:aspartate dehydrogenase
MTHTLSRNPLMRVGLIGLGAIGKSIAGLWSSSCADHCRLIAACVRPYQRREAKEMLPRSTEVLAQVERMAELGLDVIIEAAGQEAVKECGAQLLRSGADLMVLSVGALADSALSAGLEDAASVGNCRILIPSGALAGFDGLRSLRQTQGLQSVTYISRKPPRAWLKTHAETSFDLRTLRSPTVLFDGCAREAARLYPKNANLAAAVALAGLGFEDTRVQLIADPETQENVGSLHIVASTGRLDLTIGGIGAASNPKTSALTAYSVIAALVNSSARYRFV